jgi:cell division protein FtsZ
VHDLSKNKNLPAFDFLPIEESVPQKEEKIVYDLVDDFVVTEPVFEVELVPTSQFIKNLDVTFEIVSPIADHDFYITSAEVREMDVREPYFVRREEQAAFKFDLPIVNESKAEERILFELTAETRDIQVKEPVEMVPMTELNEKGIIKYSLEEYMEVENELINSKPVVAAAVAEPVAEELNITMKKVEQPASAFSSSFEEVSPLEMSIEDTLKFRADERRKKLKDFNYKFHNNPSRIDEFEKEPAYKRSGIDISGQQFGSNHSRMSLGKDSNDDVQLRSNNSFLHDNVD